MGSKSNMVCRHNRKKVTWGQWEWSEQCREWQGWLQTTRNTEGAKDYPLDPSEGAWPCWFFDFMILPSRTVKNIYCCCSVFIERGLSLWLYFQVKKSNMQKNIVVLPWMLKKGGNYIYTHMLVCTWPYVWNINHKVKKL